jgi:outer membrane protein assembly factor BamA
MRRLLGANSAFLVQLFVAAAYPIPAQTPGTATAPLREVRVDGQKHLSEAQAVALTGLALGSEVSRSDLQAAADKLSKTGLFDKISYKFETRTGVVVTYHVEESPLILTIFPGLRTPSFPTQFAGNFPTSTALCPRRETPSSKRRKRSKN